MKKIALAIALIGSSAFAADSKNPTWWDKYQFILHNGPSARQSTAAAPAGAFGTNVDVSNECGPQSETFLAINTSAPKKIAAGSHQNLRPPMRREFSSRSRP